MHFSVMRNQRSFPVLRVVRARQKKVEGRAQALFDRYDAFIASSMEPTFHGDR